MQSNVKKRLKSLLFVLILCVAMCFGVACKIGNNSSSNPEQSGAESKYVLNQPILELNVGDTFTLSVLNFNGGEGVEWRSLQAAIANVDNGGTVTAIKPGKTNVLATIGDKTLSCVVTVGIKLDLLPTLELKGMQKRDGEYKLNLMRGDEYTLTPILYLGDEEIETQFTLTSNENAVATEGNTLKANGITQTAQITVSCVYKNQTYSVICYVSVEEVAL